MVVKPQSFVLVIVLGSVSACTHPSVSAPSDIVRISVARSAGNDTLYIEPNNRALRVDRRGRPEPQAYVTSIGSEAIFAAVDVTGVRALGDIPGVVGNDTAPIVMTIERKDTQKQHIYATSYRELPPAAAAAFLLLEGAVNGVRWEPYPWGFSQCPIECTPAIFGPNPGTDAAKRLTATPTK